jgi:quercetin dioxygenase-like cupin family protein
MGQTYLTSGKRLSMRLWQNERPQFMPVTERDYGTVGYVISGRAELDLEGQTVRLEPGDSWLVPAGARHAYRILERLTGRGGDGAACASDIAPTRKTLAGAQPKDS